MRLSRKRKTDLLKAIPLFSGCSQRELEAVAAVADEVTFPAGRVLMEQGASGHELVVVVDGELDVAQRGKRVAKRAGGDFVGELAIVTQRPRNATVVAATDVRALVIHARDFERVMREAPSIAVKVVKAVGERLDPEPV